GAGACPAPHVRIDLAAPGGPRSRRRHRPAVHQRRRLRPADRSQALPRRAVAREPRLQFGFRDIGRFYGAVATAVGDLDGDGDLEVVASSWVNYWRDPGRHTLVWYENDGQQNFTAHGIASEPAGLTTLQLADMT